MAFEAARVLVCLALLGSICSIQAIPLSPVDISNEWGVYNVQRQNIAINGAVMGDTLRGVLDYPFTTPLAMVQASNVYEAGNSRFRRVVDDLKKGGSIKIVAIGGVATNGSDASQPGTDDYFALFVKYLKRAFPSATITPVRSSAGIAPSAIVAECIDNYLPSDADVVLLEMTANDAVGMDPSIIDGHNGKAYELLLRKILQSGKQPALILTQSMVNGMGNGSTPFYLTPEAPQYSTLASYYGTPVVSMRNALWFTGSPNSNGLIVTSAVDQSDGSTPLDAGHKSMADMLVYNTQQTAQDLLLLPYGEYDTSSIAKSVPERPVYRAVAADPGTVLSNSTCVWIKNISSNSRACPITLHQMCSLDFSSIANTLRTFDERVETTPRNNQAALIGGVVGGVVGGLLLIGGLLAYCIISKKRHAQKVAAAAEAKAAARRKEAASSGGHGVPITATTRIEDC